MKQFLFALILALAGSGSAWADRVGVSIHAGHPDFFGEIDLGDMAPPPLIRENPIIIKRYRNGVLLSPIYLHVPQSHARNWRWYCSRYHACGRPVYFVREDWYNNEYLPHYRDWHQHGFRQAYRGERHDANNDLDHDHYQEH